MLYSILKKQATPILAAALLTSTFMPAYAAVDQAGADELKLTLQEYLDDTSSKVDDKEIKLNLDGDLLVEPAGTYYAVTFPHISMQFPEARFDLGIIAANMAPSDKNSDEWNVTLAMPTPMTVFSDDNVPELIVNLGSQNFAGVWNEGYNIYTKYRALYKDISFDVPGEDVSIKLGSIASASDLERSDEGTWTGGGDAVMAGLDIDLGAEGHFKIAELKYEGSIDQYDFEAAKQYQENLEAVQESYLSGEASTSSGHTTALYNLVSDFMSTVWNGFDSSFSLKGMDMDVTNTPKRPNGAKFSIDEMTFNFGMMGFKTESVSMDMGVFYDGFNLEDTLNEEAPDETLTGTIPNSVNLDLKINQIPFKKLVALGKTSIETASANPEMAKLVGMQSLMASPALLTEAGTNITLADLTIKNDTYNAKSNGILTADIEAKMGAYGTGDTTIKGLPALTAIMQDQLSKPETSEDMKAKIQQGLQTLSLLQLVGQQSTNDKGDDVHGYKFELKRDGTILLNGADIKTLMQ